MHFQIGIVFQICKFTISYDSLLLTEHVTELKEVNIWKVTVGSMIEKGH